MYSVSLKAASVNVTVLYSRLSERIEGLLEIFLTDKLPECVQSFSNITIHVQLTFMD